MTDFPPTDPSKAALQSTTIQGAILSIVGALAPTLASLLHMPADDLVKAVAAVVTIIGFAMTLVGRFTATTKLH